MIKVNINKQVKPNLKHRLKLLKKVLVLKGWTIKRNIIEIEEIDRDIPSYNEYEDTFKPHWNKFFILD